MGAWLHWKVYNGLPEDLEFWYRQWRDQEIREYGDEGYSCHFGTLDPGVNIQKMEPFATEAEAEKWLDEHAEKRRSALAVPFKGEVEVPDARLRKAWELKKAARKKLEEFVSKLLRRYQTTKSKTIGCKRCGSSIARKYLTMGLPDMIHVGADDIFCPVCSSSLLTPTDHKIIERLNSRISEIQTNCQSGKAGQMVKKKGVCYVVGGLCAE